jgi:hypothetical protein
MLLNIKKTQVIVLFLKTKENDVLSKKKLYQFTEIQIVLSPLDAQLNVS